MSGNTSPASTPSREEIKKVAKLARLRLSGDELETLTAQLGQILEYVHILDELDTDTVQPMAHAIDVSNVFRQDDPQESLPRESSLSNAPKTDGESFLVPPILGGG